MKLHDCFYYTSKNDAVSYSTNPTGHSLDVSRLIRNNPCWKNNTTAMKKIPKTLILNDWSALGWSDEKCRIMRKKLFELMDEGFEIYALQERGIRKININQHLRLYIVREYWHGPFMLPDEVIKAVLTAGDFIYDQIFVLDDYWTDYIYCDAKVPENRVLGIESIFNTINKLTPELMGKISQANPPFNRISITEINDKHISALREICEILPEAKLLNLNKYEINISNISMNLLNEFSSKFDLSTVSIFSEIKTLKMDFSHEQDLVSSVLPQLCQNKINNLKKLHIIKGKSGAFKNLPEMSNIEEIYLDHCCISHFELKELFEKYPRLIKFHAESTTVTGYESNIPVQPLLKSFIFERGNISLENLQNIMQSPQLKTLSFYGSKIRGQLADFKNPTVESLNICIGSWGCEPVRLNVFLIAFPNVKTLITYDLSQVDSGLQKDFSFPCLEKLILDEDEGSWHEPDFAVSLLKSAPNIQILISEAMTHKIFNEKFMFQKLHTWIYLGTNNSEDYIHQMIKRTPNIKNLDFSRCYGDLTYIKNPSVSNVIFRQKKLHFGEGIELPYFYPEKIISLNLPITSNPVHDFEHYIDHTPTSPNEIFKFKNNYTNYSQNMIIAKLSQYMTLYSIDTKEIYKLQDGICFALSAFFLRYITEYSGFLEKILAWDGSKNTIENDEILTNWMNNLYVFVKKYQSLSSECFSYIGDNLEVFLDSYPKPMILSNPWHAIALSGVDSKGGRYIYDPNHPAGFFLRSRENLRQCIKNSLGSLISVLSILAPKPTIKNPSAFIKEGGILSLLSVRKSKELLDELPHHDQISESALSGLFLRNTSGVPAWILASKNHHIEEFVQRLLNRFKAIKGDSAQEKMIESVQAISKEDRKNIVKRIKNESEEILAYRKQFKTWKKNKSLTTEPAAWFDEILDSNQKKQLIKFDSQDHVMSMAYNLQAYCKKSGREIFYIHHPEDLVTSAPYIQRIDNKGFLINGPGGSLYNFLVKEHKKSPVLLVNYNHFEADDIVRFNTLLDEERFAEITPLPDSMQVIGLINSNRPDVYQGEDFYSRFDSTQYCPVKVFDNALFQIPLSEVTDQKTFDINLFGALDWETRLLGRWVVKQDNLYFEEGLLARALQSGLPVKIQNANWHDPDFVHFWQQAMVNKCIEFEGETFLIPDNLQLIKAEGYHWSNLLSNVRWERGVKKDKDAQTLNPGLLNTFFTRYQCDNSTSMLNTQPGFVQTHANQSLHVNLTRDLTQSEWAMLLDDCLNHRTQLHVHVYPSLKLNALPNVQMDPGMVPEKNRDKNNLPLVIESDDSDTTVAMILNKDPNWQVIDISECEAGDLLLHISARLNRETMRIEFKEEKRLLLNAMQTGQKIILKGIFKASLADALMPLILDSPSNLILLPDEKGLFPDAVQYAVTKEEKRQCLEQIFSADELKAEEKNFLVEPLSKLKARLYHRRYHPDSDSADAWEGMYSLPADIELADFNPNDSAVNADRFARQRLLSVLNVFEYAPYVFLTGLTAVGKTSFVEKELSAYVSLHQGEQHLIDWAIDKSNKLKVLFIDEANIGSRQWSEFEGLFQTSPGIFIHGKWHQLDERHKVVFAGNPMSYGGDRQMPELFKRHGNAVVFNPLTLDFIYERILKPIFENSVMADNAIAAAMEILKAYQLLCKWSRDEVLISPRELQMMALMAVAALERNRERDSRDVVLFYIRLIAVPLVPNERMDEFNKEFPVADKFVANEIFQSGAFYITPSRRPLVNLIEDLLKLRSKRRQNPGNEAQQYGGLGGLVLEGAPGIGKSEIVRHVLNQHSDCSYVAIPVSMPSLQKRNMLLKAFDEGAVVIMDEINSSPMMERLLNDLLMGRGPSGLRPKQPGFFVIGTQNPVTMAGRRKLGKALDRRIITIRADMLPEYTTEEMQLILEHKGLNSDTSALLIKAYSEQKQKAEKAGLSPAPTFRDLLKIVREKLMSKYSKAKRILDTEIKRLCDRDEKMQCFINIQCIQPSYHKIKALEALKNVFDGCEQVKSSFAWLDRTACAQWYHLNIDVFAPKRSYQITIFEHSHDTDSTKAIQAAFQQIGFSIEEVEQEAALMSYDEMSYSFN